MILRLILGTLLASMQIFDITVIKNGTVRGKIVFYR